MLLHHSPVVWLWTRPGGTWTIWHLLAIHQHSNVVNLKLFTSLQVDKELLPLGSICLFVPDEHSVVWIICEMLIFLGIYILPSCMSLLCSSLTTIRIVKRAYAKWRLDGLRHTSINEHQHAFASAGLSSREISVLSDRNPKSMILKLTLLKCLIRLI